MTPIPHKRVAAPEATPATPSLPRDGAGRPDPFAPLQVPANGSGHPSSSPPAVRPSATAGGEQDPGPSAVAAGPDPLPAGGATTGRGASPAGIQALAAAMSEADLEEHIRAICNDLGILRFHVRDSRGMNRGLPDDILIGARGVLWRECKTQKGRVTPEQRAVGEALSALGQDFAVWRPSHLLSGKIARELAALAGIGAAA